MTSSQLRSTELRLLTLSKTHQRPVMRLRVKWRAVGHGRTPDAAGSMTDGDAAVIVYTMVHKKLANLFLTITLVFHGGFLDIMYQRKHE